MLECDRIDAPEGIHVLQHQWFAQKHFHYLCFLEINFRFQLKVCDGCLDLMQKTTSFNDATIVPVKGNDYMSNNEALILF